MRGRMCKKRAFFANLRRRMISKCSENRWWPAHRIMASIGIILLPWQLLKLKWRIYEFSTKNPKNAKKTKSCRNGPKIGTHDAQGSLAICSKAEAKISRADMLFSSFRAGRFLKLLFITTELLLFSTLPLLFPLMLIFITVMLLLLSCLGGILT